MTVEEKRDSHSICKYTNDLCILLSKENLRFVLANKSGKNITN